MQTKHCNLIVAALDLLAAEHTGHAETISEAERSLEVEIRSETEGSGGNLWDYDGGEMKFPVNWRWELL